MIKKILLFLLIPSICFGATISRENIKPKADYKANGDTFYMVNMTCAEENTVLSNVKDCTFVRSNIVNCILDETNNLTQSIYEPEQPAHVDADSYETLVARVEQLETFIEDNSLVVPAKEVE